MTPIVHGKGPPPTRPPARSVPLPSAEELAEGGIVPEDEARPSRRIIHGWEFEKHEDGTMAIVAADRQPETRKELNLRKLAIGVQNHDHRCGSDGVCHYCAYGLADPKGCETCGKPMNHREHRGVVTHYFHAIGKDRAAEGFAPTILNRDPIPEERPRDPNYSGPGRRHRTFPWAWWLRRCKCRDCTRTVDRIHIAQMEKECRVRDTTTGELIWPDPKVGDQDEHGRTVVAVLEGHIVWDRTAPPAPPRPDPGKKSWV